MFERFRKTTLQSAQTADAVETTAEREELRTDALSWEASHIMMAYKSEQRAWNLLYCAVILIVLLIVAIVLMQPLKEAIPYEVRVDNTTGYTDVVTRMDIKAVDFDDVMDKYWLTKYVRARETYDWYTLQDDYDTVGLLSVPLVGKEYASLFDGSNALDKHYGNKTRVSVAIVSVVPNGKGMGTVRFTKTTKRVDDVSSTGTVTRWVATIAYEYRKSSLLKESERLINPLGFQVQSYRVDPEI